MDREKLKEILDSIMPGKEFWWIQNHLKPADIDPKKWYIVDLTKPHKPRYIRKTFESKKQAMSVFEEHYGYGIGGYFPAKGEELIRFNIPARKWHKFTKYKYLPSYTQQKRHSLRVKQRRADRKALVKDKSWNPKRWVYPPDAKTPYQKQLHRVKVRRARIRRIARET